MNTSSPSPMRHRRHDLDWLRVLAMGAVFLFHCVHLFDPVDWHVKDGAESFTALLVVGFMDGWLMPLFFMLSGAATWFSLRGRSPGQYVGERFLRLVVPMYTVGAFLLLPPQYYWELLTHGRLQGGFWDAYAQFFSTWLPNASYGYFMFWSGHLWFLYFLLVISLLLLPVVLLLKSAPGQALLARLARWSRAPGGVFLPLVPLAVVMFLLKPVPGERVMSDLIPFSVYFLLGVGLAAQPGFMAAAVRQRWAALVAGVAAYGGMGALLAGAGVEPWRDQPMTWPVALSLLCMVLHAWAWIVFFLGMAGKHLTRDNAFLRHANEAVLPFYILHQTAILLVATWVVTLHWPWGLKLVVLATASLAIILPIYELFVRRFNAVRFLFGMRPRKRAAPAAD